jgi:hypothetical protein
MSTIGACAAFRSSPRFESLASLAPHNEESIMATTSEATMGTRSSRLFGSFSAVLRGHEELRQSLKRLAEMCDTLELGVAPRLSPEHLIHTLRSELREHFAAEEADAYFGAIVRERPALAHTVAALRQEHQKLVKEADDLEGLARDRSRWSALPRPTLALMGHLRAHEHAKTRLLQEFFLRDEGSGAD